MGMAPSSQDESVTDPNDSMVASKPVLLGGLWRRTLTITLCIFRIEHY